MKGRILAALAAFALAGCSEEGIQRYRVPKPAPPPQPAQDEHPHDHPKDHSHDQSHPQPEPPRTPFRLLGAIVPHGEATWFFKVTGPIEELEKHVEAFDKMLASIRFEDAAGEKIAWTLPDGWRAEPGSAMRYATLRMGPGDAAPALSVIPLGKQSGTLLQNVNRWREQLGLAPVDEAGLAQVTSAVTVGGGPGTRVDLRTEGAAAAAPGAGGTATTPAGTGPTPTPGGTGPSGTAATGPLRFETPAGWTQKAEPGPMKAAAFTVTDGAQSAEMSIIPLPGAAGGLLANVNRWRGQVKLAPIGEAELAAAVKPLDVAGAPGQYVDLAGPEARILGAIRTVGDTTWFFKLQGPADLVGKHQSAFESFVRTLRIEAGTGGK